VSGKGALPADDAWPPSFYDPYNLRGGNRAVHPFRIRIYRDMMLDSTGPKRPPHLCQNRVYYPLNRESGVLASTRCHYILTPLYHYSYGTSNLGREVTNTAIRLCRCCHTLTQDKSSCRTCRLLLDPLLRLLRRNSSVQQGRGSSLGAPGLRCVCTTAVTHSDPNTRSTHELSGRSVQGLCPSQLLAPTQHPPGAPSWRTCARGG
jgi:hypothetical protein